MSNNFETASDPDPQESEKEFVDQLWAYPEESQLGYIFSKLETLSSHLASLTYAQIPLGPPTTYNIYRTMAIIAKYGDQFISRSPTEMLPGATEVWSCFRKIMHKLERTKLTPDQNRLAIRLLHLATVCMFACKAGVTNIRANGAWGLGPEELEFCNSIVPSIQPVEEFSSLIPKVTKHLCDFLDLQS
jgi:hypothetical protein